VNEHESGRFGWQHHLWNLLVLEIWHREVADAPRGASDAPSRAVSASTAAGSAPRTP
jgi:hypothetical protein